MRLFPSAVYLLCALSSLLALWLVYRSYRRSPTRLLLWSSLAFVALAINNVVLFVDIVLLPDISLLPIRHATELIAVGFLLYGFIWEAE
jgi:hypothetical protein